MKKRWTALAGILLAGLLAGCEEPAAGTSPQPTEEPSVPVESITPAPSPTPAETPVSQPTAPAESAAPTPVPAEVLLDPSLEPPLTEFSASIAVPDFLTREQQDLYRRAHCLYQAMFGGETTAIDYLYPATGDMEWEYHDEDYWAIGEFGWHYTPAQGRYQRWADFDALVHSVFTEDFWQRHNILETGDPIYQDFDGRLGILDFSKGGGWYNENFPDQFRLEEQTGDTISFTLICPYTEPYPQNGETYEERDRRLETVVDYTLEFPIKMVLTGDGWRFDGFHSGLADET